jgi:hypothetical protein
MLKDIQFSAEVSVPARFANISYCRLPRAAAATKEKAGADGVSATRERGLRNARTCIAADEIPMKMSLNGSLASRRAIG